MDIVLLWWPFDFSTHIEHVHVYSYFQKEEYPKILMGFFVEKPTPFIPEFLNRMMQLEYPKKRIDLFIHNTVSIEILCYVIYWKCLSLILIMILCWHLSWIAQLWGLSFKFIILIITIIISSGCAAVTFCVLCIFFLHSPLPSLSLS